jgi:hypothetical protein
MNEHKPSLDELLARMPRDVAPSRDLWSGIARDLERGPRRLSALAMAASVVAICVTAAMALAVFRGAAPPQAMPAVAGRLPSLEEPSDPAYRAARAELQKSFNERLAILDPKTRAKIEASLVVIQQAHEETRRALLAEPANPVLEGLLESTWQDEFDLYDDVVRNTQPALLRS